MPGIIGFVRPGRAPDTLDGALDTLAHLNTYVSRTLPFGPDVDLGQSWRSAADAARGWYVDDEEQVAILVAGTVIEPLPSPRVIGPSDLFAAYRDATLDIARYDGAFVIVVADLTRRSLTVHNDRLGALPVHYTTSGGVFCCAPEAKAVFAATGHTPSLSPEGVVGFVARGYNLARQTIFSDVHMLEPGSTINVSLDTAAADVRRVWKMRYRASNEYHRRKSAESALNEAIVAGHQTAVAGGGTFDILLSGGLDSRGNLAALHRIGQLPREAFAWGLRADLEGSDPAIARTLAERFQIPFRFLSYDTDEFLANARQWCLTSELANDNIGWYAEGAPVLASSYQTGADFVITGDEPWGVGGYAGDASESRASVLPHKLPHAFAAILSDVSAERAAAFHDAEITSLTCQCDSEDWLDIKDFLYVHGRLARFVFSLGYYKELAVEVRRPFLAGAVLDVVQHLPGRHRVYKNAFVSTLRRFYPEVMDLPDSSVDSLPDWEFDIRSNAALRSTFLDLLESERATAGVLAGLVDPARLQALTAAYFGETATPMTRAPQKDTHPISRLLPGVVRRRSRGLDRLRRALGRGTLKRGRSTFDTLRAVALVAMLEQQLSGFGKPGQ